MKKVILFFALAFLVISGVMLYLVKVGVSLRPAPYIKPSAMTAGISTVARDVGLRLFPDLQGVDYIVWGIPENDPESLELLSLMKAEEEKSKGKPVELKQATPATSTEELAKCQTPCWILQSQQEAHELKEKSFTAEKLLPLVKDQQKKYFTLTIVPFEYGKPVPDECWAERRLDFECIQLVSVQITERKMPKEARGKTQAERGRYFFLNKYNESDYFLYLEKNAK